MSLTRFAIGDMDGEIQTAKEVAGQARLPQPTVSKLLKMLAKGGLLIATRGVKGGYQLSRPAREITLAQIITAIDGPIVITDCLSARRKRCAIGSPCPMRDGWEQINEALHEAFDSVTLADIATPAKAAPCQSRT